MTDTYKPQGDGPDSGENSAEKIDDPGELSRARARAEDADLKEGEKKEDPPLGFVLDCHSTELGHGTLLATMNQDSFVCDKNDFSWYLWTGTYLKRDLEETIFHAVEKVAQIIERAAAQVIDEDRRKKAFRSARGLRTLRGARAALDYSHRIPNGLGVDGAEFNSRRGLVCTGNRVIETDTGRVRRGYIKDKITLKTGVQWEGFREPLRWKNFLFDVLGSKEKVDYFQRFLGYTLTGYASENVFLILTNSGAGGKSLTLEVLLYVLGEYAAPVPAGLFLEQKYVSSAGSPTAELEHLKGLRLAVIPETAERDRFSPARFKTLTGSDKVVSRAPHAKNMTTFELQCSFIMATNHLPAADGSDFAFWRRCHVLDFPFRFVDSPSGPNEKKRIRGLAEGLKTEGPAILAWLIEGAVLWCQQGLQPPPSVLAATEKYRAAEDVLGEFLAACCYPPEGTPNERAPFGDLYNRFSAWYLATVGSERSLPRKKRFSGLIERAGFKRVREGGKIFFIGLDLRPQDD